MKVYINEKIINLNLLKKYTILEACLALGIYIPHFCYNKNLNIAGNCRMCVIEIYKLGKPQISCLNLCVENLKVYTNTFKIKKLQENIMEFLLINHPLDCPICDQGGECDLQEQTLYFGLDRSRFLNKKKTLNDIFINLNIKLILNRCILCLRCVRFLKEYDNSFKNVLGNIGRGFLSQIGFFKNYSIDLNISGNIIDLCPVSNLIKYPYYKVEKELNKFSFEFTNWYKEESYSVKDKIIFEVNENKPYVNYCTNLDKKEDLLKYNIFKDIIQFEINLYEYCLYFVNNKDIIFEKKFPGIVLVDKNLKIIQLTLEIGMKELILKKFIINYNLLNKFNIKQEMFNNLNKVIKSKLKNIINKKKNMYYVSKTFIKQNSYNFVRFFSTDNIWDQESDINLIIKDIKNKINNSKNQLINLDITSKNLIKDSSSLFKENLTDVQKLKIILEYLHYNIMPDLNYLYIALLKYDYLTLTYVLNAEDYIILDDFIVVKMISIFKKDELLFKFLWGMLNRKKEFYDLKNNTEISSEISFIALDICYNNILVYYLEGHEILNLRIQNVNYVELNNYFLIDFSSIKNNKINLLLYNLSEEMYMCIDKNEKMLKLEKDRSIRKNFLRFSDKDFNFSFDYLTFTQQVSIFLDYVYDSRLKEFKDIIYENYSMVLPLKEYRCLTKYLNKFDYEEDEVKELIIIKMNALQNFDINFFKFLWILLKNKSDMYKFFDINFDINISKTDLYCILSKEIYDSLNESELEKNEIRIQDVEKAYNVIEYYYKESKISSIFFSHPVFQNRYNLEYNSEYLPSYFDLKNFQIISNFFGIPYYIYKDGEDEYMGLEEDEYDIKKDEYMELDEYEFIEDEYDIKKDEYMELDEYEFIEDEYDIKKDKYMKLDEYKFINYRELDEDFEGYKVYEFIHLKDLNGEYQEYKFITYKTFNNEVIGYEYISLDGNDKCQFIFLDKEFSNLDENDLDLNKDKESSESSDSESDSEGDSINKNNNGEIMLNFAREEVYDFDSDNCVPFILRKIKRRIEVDLLRELDDDTFFTILKRIFFFKSLKNKLFIRFDYFSRYTIEKSYRSDLIEEIESLDIKVEKKLLNIACNFMGYDILRARFYLINNLTYRFYYQFFGNELILVVLNNVILLGKIEKIINDNIIYVNFNDEYIFILILYENLNKIENFENFCIKNTEECVEGELCIIDYKNNVVDLFSNHLINILSNLKNINFLFIKPNNILEEINHILDILKFIDPYKNVFEFHWTFFQDKFLALYSYLRIPMRESLIWLGLRPYVYRHKLPKYYLLEYLFLGLNVYESFVQTKLIYREYIYEQQNENLKLKDSIERIILMPKLYKFFFNVIGVEMIPYIYQNISQLILNNQNKEHLISEYEDYRIKNNNTLNQTLYNYMEIIDPLLCLLTNHPAILNENFSSILSSFFEISNSNFDMIITKVRSKVIEQLINKYFLYSKVYLKKSWLQLKYKDLLNTNLFELLIKCLPNTNKSITDLIFSPYSLFLRLMSYNYYAYGNIYRVLSDESGKIDDFNYYMVPEDQLKKQEKRLKPNLTEDYEKFRQLMYDPDNPFLDPKLLPIDNPYIDLDDLEPIEPIGALTSKLNQMLFRPWEINSFILYDLYDSFSGDLRIDYKFKKVVRILPSLDKNFSLEVITDKIRFGKDLYKIYFKYIREYKEKKIKSTIVIPLDLKSVPFIEFNNNISFLNQNIHRFFNRVISFYKVCLFFFNNLKFINNNYVLNLKEFKYMNEFFIDFFLITYVIRFIISLKKINKKNKNIEFFIFEDLNFLNNNFYRFVNNKNLLLTKLYSNNSLNRLFFFDKLNYLFDLLSLELLYIYKYENEISIEILSMAYATINETSFSNLNIEYIWNKFFLLNKYNFPKKFNKLKFINILGENYIDKVYIIKLLIFIYITLYVYTFTFTDM